MKKTVVIVFMLIVSIMLSAPAYAQSAKEAVMGLKKLQARCQSGISYRDYGNALADAKFPVNLFMESADAKKYPELTESINKAMGHYEYAGQLWNLKISASKYDPHLRHGFFGVGTDTGKEIGKLYPQAVPGKEYGYFLDELFSVIWGAASKELDNATKLYTKTESDISNDCDKLKKENANLKKEIERLKSKAKK